MNFASIIQIFNKIIKNCEKFNFEFNYDFDTLIDNNFPDLVSKFQPSTNKDKILICATNGKRTIVNLLNQIFIANNQTNFMNISKIGEIKPLVTSLIAESIKNNEFNSFNRDFYTIPANAYDLYKNFKLLNFDILLLHNIFYSQTDCASNIEKRKKIQSALVLNSKLNLLINADDPFLFEIDDIKDDSVLSKKRSKFYYGFDEIEVFDKSGKFVQRNDLIRCPKCGCELTYEKRYYSHIGKYACECGFRRPNLNVSAQARVFADYSFLTVLYNDHKMVFKVPIGGVYNIYNALGAISFAIYSKIDRKTITNALENYKPLEARDDILEVKDHLVKVKIMTNAVALSEALQELAYVKNKKLVFCFSSDYQDGIDTSWIWNANLEVLNNFENKVYITGKRYDDMALRLKYAGVNPSLILMDNSISNTIKTAINSLEKNEQMLIVTVPSLKKELYKALK